MGCGWLEKKSGVRVESVRRVRVHDVIFLCVCVICVCVCDPPFGNTMSCYAFNYCMDY